MQQVLFRIPWKTSWFPDGIPIYGFGMMLFIAFILCTWLAGRRAARLINSGIGLGRYLGGQHPLVVSLCGVLGLGRFLDSTHQNEDYPAGDTPEERVEASKALIQDLAIWLFITGLLGARLTYMYHNPQDDGSNFFARLIDITNGGIILYGSIVGGLVGYLLFSLYLYVRRNAVLNTLRIADLVAPTVALGIGLGRIGCLLNGCCYGHVACADCSLAPSVRFPLSAPPRDSLVKKGYQTIAGFTLADVQAGVDGVRVGVVDPASAAYQAGLRPGNVIVEANNKPIENEDALFLLFYRDWPRGQKDLTLKVRKDGEEVALPTFRPRTLALYPTQVFETISMALLCLLLWAYFPFRRHDGQVMALLMMCYAVHRTLNEMLRDDVRPVGFESYSSYILFGAGALLMLWVTLRPKQYRGEWELAK